MAIQMHWEKGESVAAPTVDDKPMISAAAVAHAMGRDYIGPNGSVTHIPYNGGPPPSMEVPNDVQPGDWLASLSSAERKQCAMERGLLAYFPDALALVSRHSVRSNEKHNPGQPVHWARGKSTDHGDCVIRHSVAVAIDPNAQDDGQYEMICRAWRALAALQEWSEKKFAAEGKID